MHTIYSPIVELVAAMSGSGDNLGALGKAHPDPDRPGYRVYEITTGDRPRHTDDGRIVVRVEYRRPDDWS